MKYKSIISASIIAVMLGLVGCGSGSASNNAGTGSTSNSSRTGTNNSNNGSGTGASNSNGNGGTSTDGTITNRINRLFDGTMTDGYDNNVGNYNNDNRYGYGMNGAENIIGNGRNATGYYNNSLTDRIGTNDYDYGMSDYQSQITTNQTQNNNTTNTANLGNTDNNLNMTNTSS